MQETVGENTHEEMSEKCLHTLMYSNLNVKFKNKHCWLYTKYNNIHLN